MKIVEGIILVGLGVGAGWLVAPRPSVPATVVEHETAEAVSVVPSTTTHYVAAPAQPRLAATNTPDTRERASTIVHDAINRHEWVAADREALRAEFDALPGDAQAEIAQELAAAVNRGEVRITMDDPPL